MISAGLSEMSESKIVVAGKYAPLPKAAGPQIIMRRRKLPGMREWVRKAMKPGGPLYKYYEFKRSQTAAALRAVAIRTKDFKQNNNVDARVLAHVPLWTYIMMRKMDPHFFCENSNLKALKRDEPDARVYL